MKNGSNPGRLYAPDPRDRLFAAAPVVPLETARMHRYWNAGGWWGDQGSLPQCVAYAWTHWLEDGPVTHKGEPAPHFPQMLYARAQILDEWEGEMYDGTSVRAGAKAIQELGFIESYRWPFAWNEFEIALLEAGPIVIGIDWYAGMERPDPKTAIIEPKGELVGGHALKADGISRKKRLVRLKQSRGRRHGRKGHVFIGFDELEHLIFGANGEACLAIERPGAIQQR